MRYANVAASQIFRAKVPKISTGRLSPMPPRPIHRPTHEGATPHQNRILYYQIGT